MARLDILRSLHRFCLECQGEDPHSVRVCEDTECALWPWRMGCKAQATEDPQACPAAPPVCAAESAVAAVAAAEEESPAAKAARRMERSRRALRAIRRQCLACAGDKREVRQCPAREECYLWSLRFGVRPETYKAVRKRFTSPKALTLY